MKPLRQLLAVTVLTVLLFHHDIGNGQDVGTLPTLSVNFVLSSSKYLLGVTADPITAEITIRNTGNQPIITSAGFSQKPFHLFLTFVGPDGRPITAAEAGSGVHEGGPPKVTFLNGNMVQVQEVEILPVGYIRTLSIPDLRAFYDFPKAGRYSVKSTISLITYSGFFTSNGISYAEIASFNFAGAIESGKLNFSLIADTDGDGYSYPEPDSRISNFTLPDCDDNDANINPGRAETLGDGKDNDCNPATPDVVEGPVAVLKDIAVTLNTIFLNNQGNPFAKELESALERANRALQELDKTRPEIRKAVERIDEAADKVENAVKKGFDSTQAALLMDRLAGLARQLAVDALNQAIAQNGSPKKITEAQQDLAAGNTFRAAGDFESALKQYEKALKDAQQALLGRHQNPS